MRSLVLLSAGIQCLFLIGFALGGKGGGGGSSFSSSSRGSSFSSSSSSGGGSRPSSSGSSSSSSSGSGSSFSGSSNSRPSSGSSTSNSGSGSIFSGGSKPNSGAGTGSSTGSSGSGTPSSSGSSFGNWLSSWGSKTPSSSSGSSSGSSFGTGSGSGSTQTNNNKPKLVPSAPVLPMGSGGSSGGGSVPPLKPLVYPYPTNQASNGQTSTNQLPPLRYPYPANSNQPKQPSAPPLPPLVYPYPKSQTTGQQQPTYFNPNRLGGQMMGGAPSHASNQPSPVNVVLLTPGRPVASKSQKILTTLAGAYVGGKIVRTVSDLPRASYSPWGYSRYMPHYHRTYYYGLPSYYGYHDHYYYYHNYYQNGGNRWTTTKRPGDKTVQPALNQTDFIALLNLTSFNWNDTTTTAEYNNNTSEETNNKNVCIFPLADEDQLIDENGTRIQELIFECSSNETCCELDCCDDTKLQAFLSEHIIGNNSTDENKEDLEFNEILKGFTDKLLSGNFSSDPNSTWDFPSEMDNMVKKLLGLTGGPPSTGQLLASGSDATPSPRMTQNYHEWENKATCHSGLSWSLLAITIIIMPVLMASVV